MQLTAILLVVLSAFIHAGWNLASKRQHPSASFFLVSCLTGALVLSPVVILSYDTIVHRFPLRVWWFLGSTGFFLAFYYTSLAAAYRSGDMSIAYPLARSSPVIVVSVVTILLGRGNEISGVGIGGIILVVGGCFLVPLKRLGDFKWMNYLTPTCGLALLAAVGTSGYSIIDDEALDLLRADPDIALSTIRVTLLYACFEAAAASFWLALFVMVRPNGRSDLREVLRTKKRQACFTGASIYLAYSMVLVSLAFARNVSYVVGFRQLSIPLGAILGIIALKEPPYVPKLAGVAIMFVGLVLLAVG